MVSSRSDSSFVSVQFPAPRSMDLTSLRCLINSISRFIHTVTSCLSKSMPVETEYRNIAALLKHLKPVLDYVSDYKETLDEALYKECEDFDIAVNEAREFIEKWSPKMSKILCVLQSKKLVLKIQISSVKLSSMLCRLSESSPNIATLSNAQFCLKESQNLNPGNLSQYMKEILETHKEGNFPVTQRLIAIIDSLNLRSNQEFLNESIALEKERQKSEENTNTDTELNQISCAINLLTHIRDFLLEVDTLKGINGISVPSYFRCPLSLELMRDPVIVSSGQTYERASIQKWLDHGLVNCPKTGQTLSHKNLIPNYTVKALISHWCKEKKAEPSINPTNTNSSSQENDHERKNSTARSSFEVTGGESVISPQKSDQSSPEHSYVHSRSESNSSVFSSIEYLPPTLTETKKGDTNGYKYAFRSLSISSNSGSTQDLTTISDVEKLVIDLKSESPELQISAARELRFLAKHNTENRFIISQCGAIPPLISLLNSNYDQAQEHAVTALLNLSINEKIKSKIADENALEPLINVLRTGNPCSKENSAAAIFSLSLLDEYRVKIGRSSAVKLLVDLLRSGTIRGKKDAATALFNLSIFHENKARIVQAGAVKYLVDFLDPECEMVDKSIALLANLSTITEGCSAIAREGGIPLLVEILDIGSHRGKENAASILLQLCINSTKYCRNVLQEGAVPPLVALTQSGTPRAKEKAQQLLSHFRNQRESNVSRGRS